MSRQNVGALILAIVFTAWAAGLAGATRELVQFSPVSEGFLVGVVGMAGVALGGLVGGFAQLLAAILLVTLGSGGIMTGALLLSEWGDAGLGVEATLSVAISKAVLTGFFFVFPVTLIGALIGRLLHRE
uniref:Uncharacterized protein n=2 Tax=Candidatus Bipolaricaulota TaxID=67810 RepID=H5SMN7_9BACT|nr:hypothetical protein HGMM_F50D11C32 [uncultured Acetothermia bacterium]BAL59805.1 hypothetical protein HGMM_OP4C441 [Candidatus Acetothermum autotrophicum]